MTAPPSIDLSGWLAEQLAEASPDLLRQMITTFVQALTGAEADSVCGAEYGARAAERTNTRNGYRRREWDTPGPAASIWPFPSCGPGRTSRSGCLSAGVAPRPRWCRWWPRATCLGSARGGWRSWSRPSASPACPRARSARWPRTSTALDGQVEAFRTRPLNAGPYTFLAADALVLKVREGGRIVNVHALLATGVNADGYKEILGPHVTSAEDGFRLRAPGAGTSRKRSLVTDLADDLPKPDWSSTRLLSTHVKTG